MTGPILKEGGQSKSQAFLASVKGGMVCLKTKTKSSGISLTEEEGSDSFIFFFNIFNIF